MYQLKELTIFEFDQYAEKHPLRSMYQTSTYAMYLVEQGYEYELLGLVDDNQKIYAASLIAIKKFSFLSKYAYAPRGFLIDYYDQNLLTTFCKLLSKRYFKKNIAYIKINPEIAIAKINDKKITLTQNKQLEESLKYNGFIKVEEDKSFTNILPKYNAILRLKDFAKKNLVKPTRNKINKSLRNGLSIELQDLSGIKTLYNIIKTKEKKPINDYYNLYNAFSKNNNIDIFLVKINFEEALINEKKKYEKELIRNQKLNDKLMTNNNEANLKNKMASDAVLIQSEENIMKYTQYLSKQHDEYIAGAITIKYQDRVYIVSSGYYKKYKNICPNYYLYYTIMEYYHKDYNFIDLNGITNNFEKDNKYYGLNEFKLGFKPEAFEYIGEYDYIINEGLYEYIQKKKKKK